MNQFYELVAGQNSDGTLMSCRKCQRSLHRNYNSGEDQLYWVVKSLVVHPITQKEYLLLRGFECVVCTPEAPGRSNEGN